MTRDENASRENEVGQREETVEVGDGAFALPVWLPQSGRGPGVLVLQEIFGVGPYIRSVAADLAALGYVAAAPDLFWRLTPNWEASHDESGLKDSLALVQRFDFETGVRDSIAALRHLRGLDEVTGKAAVLGFCLGGSLAHVMAAHAEVDAAVSLYGSAVPGALDLLDRIEAPVQYHFGGSDPYIPREDVAKVEAAANDRANVEVHVQEEAGHAFHNFMAPAFHDRDAADRAWQLVTSFLATHLS